MNIIFIFNELFMSFITIFFIATKNNFPYGLEWTVLVIVGLYLSIIVIFGIFNFIQDTI